MVRIRLRSTAQKSFITPIHNKQTKKGQNQSWPASRSLRQQPYVLILTLMGRLSHLNLTLTLHTRKLLVC
jgi:hypothetical protein